MRDSQRLQRARLTCSVLAVATAALWCSSIGIASDGSRLVATEGGSGTMGQVASQQQPGVPPAGEGTAEAVVRALYQHVTFDAGKTVDWEQVKALFVPEATIVLRTSRTDMTVFNRDGFVAEFVKFISEANLEDRAFEETIVGIRTRESGDMARAIVHYAARIPSDGRPAQNGLDAFLLMKRDGVWRIVSIVNEIVRPGVPVPDDIKAPGGAGG